MALPLFTTHIETLTAVTDGALVPIENGSEARWAIDSTGRQWVRKREADTGFQPLLAEAISYLLARRLGVRQPEGAVYADESGLSWMSERIVAAGEHWEPDMRDLIANPAELAAMFVLDALIVNEDRHRRNLLVQPVGDETRLRLWAIDSGNALIGQIDDFIARGVEPPNPSNHARGLPVGALRDAALAVAAVAHQLDESDVRAYVKEGCRLVKEARGLDLANALFARCREAPTIVTGYLDLVGALR